MKPSPRSLRQLAGHRELIFEMARREFAERYLGQFFGTLWQLLHPITFIAIYIVIFGFAFKAKAAAAAGGETHYVSYLLSGLMPWMLFQEVMGRAPTVVTGNASLVKQVVFPLEILPIKSVLASMVSQAPYLIAALLYIAVFGSGLSMTLLLLPLLLLAQAAAMVGVSYGLSAVGVYVRDAREVVQLFARVGVYLAPVVYVADQLPALLQKVLLLNPFSHMIWCYHDAIYAGAIQHPISWAIFPGTALLTLVTGFWAFRRLAPHFGSVL